MKAIFKMIVDVFAITASLIGDTFYNTAVMNGAGAGAVAAIGFFIGGLTSNFAAGPSVFATFAALFAAGLVRGLVYDETPVSDFFNKRWFNKTDPVFVEDITPFLMDDDEAVVREKPFKMGCEK
jgi:hypothetical protein